MDTISGIRCTGAWADWVRLSTTGQTATVVGDLINLSLQPKKTLSIQIFSKICLREVACCLLHFLKISKICIDPENVSRGTPIGIEFETLLSASYSSKSA